MTPDSVIDLYTAECLEVHALMDTVRVPRTLDDGSKLSMAQRVAIAAGVLERVLGTVGAPQGASLQ